MSFNISEENYIIGGIDTLKSFGTYKSAVFCVPVVAALSIPQIAQLPSTPGSLFFFSIVSRVWDIDACQNLLHFVNTRQNEKNKI